MRARTPKKTPASKAVPEWKKYQETAVTHFKDLGLDVQMDVTIKGVRTMHDVDVLVTSRHAGFVITWIVECKLWNTKVSKLHVLALREIVADTGADRGILLAESGFQSGALEAAALTNVHLTSLTKAQATASAEIYAMRLRELYDRVEAARIQYWDIPKDRRIDSALRADVGTYGYSGARVIDVTSEALSRALRGAYPFELDTIASYVMPGFRKQFASVEVVISAIEPLIQELEEKLKACIEGSSQGTF